MKLRAMLPMTKGEYPYILFRDNGVCVSNGSVGMVTNEVPPFVGAINADVIKGNLAPLEDCVLSKSGVMCGKGYIKPITTSEVSKDFDLRSLFCDSIDNSRTFPMEGKEMFNKLSTHSRRFLRDFVKSYGKSYLRANLRSMSVSFYNGKANLIAEFYDQDFYDTDLNIYDGACTIKVLRCSYTSKREVSIDLRKLQCYLDYLTLSGEDFEVMHVSNKSVGLVTFENENHIAGIPKAISNTTIPR